MDDHPELDEAPRGPMVAVHARIWTPVGDGSPLDLNLLIDYLRHLRELFNVQQVRFDPHMFHHPATILADEGLWMEEYPQTNERMAPASMRTYDLITTERVEHDGHPVFADHIAAAATTPVSDRSWRITKRGASGQMDACVGTVMAAPLAAGAAPNIGIDWGA